MAVGPSGGMRCGRRLPRERRRKRSEAERRSERGERRTRLVGLAEADWVPEQVNPGRRQCTEAGGAPLTVGAVARTGRPSVLERPPLRLAAGLAARTWCVGCGSDRDGSPGRNGNYSSAELALVGRGPRYYWAGHDRPLPGTVGRRTAGIGDGRYCK